MGRRDELAEAAADYALEYGVIGLSLRPLAAAIGTSDRMLVYHFGTRAALIAEIVERCTARSVRAVEDLPDADGVAAAVRQLWTAYTTVPQLDRCQRVYAQAAAEGLLGDEASAPTVAKVNEDWTACVGTYLIRCGANPGRARRAARFVDAGIAGLHLDVHVEEATDDLAQVVTDLAQAAEALATGQD